MQASGIYTGKHELGFEVYVWSPHEDKQQSLANKGCLQHVNMFQPNQPFSHSGHIHHSILSDGHQWV